MCIFIVHIRYKLNINGWIFYMYKILYVRKRFGHVAKRCIMQEEMLLYNIECYSSQFLTFLTITQIYHDHQANGILTHTKTDLF